MNVLHLTPRSDTTTAGEHGWYMVQLNANRSVANETGPMSRESAFALAAEAANNYDGHLYGMRRPDGLVMVVDPGDDVDYDAYPYLDEHTPAVAA